MLSERPLGIQELNMTLTCMSQKVWLNCTLLWRQLSQERCGKGHQTREVHPCMEAHADALAGDLLSLSCAFQYHSRCLRFSCLISTCHSKTCETLIDLLVTLLSPCKWLGHFWTGRLLPGRIRSQVSMTVCTYSVG